MGTLHCTWLKDFSFTRLLGRFTPIFYLNCEHVLFVYILKQRRKNFADLKKKAPIGSAVLTFIGYKQTNRQTDRQAKFSFSFLGAKYTAMAGQLRG